jgi:orotate phosphoribosyltransferase
MGTTQEKEIASALLEIGAVFIKTKEEDYFTWASGTRSPIYCDNRIILSYPSIRNLVRDAFIKIIEDKFPQTELIAGIATAGIPHAAMIANELELPLIYVRPETKSHGRQRQIEGIINGSPKTLLIEDLISTGGSSLKAYEVLKETSAQTIGLLAIFTYELSRSIKAFEEKSLNFQTLSNYSALLEIAKEKKIIDSEETLKTLQDWREKLI